MSSAMEILIKALREQRKSTMRRSEYVFLNQHGSPLSVKSSGCTPTFGALRRNPRTGEEIKIKAKNVAKFSAGKALKDAVA